jgi:surface antigen
MRGIAAMLAVAALAGCVQGPDTLERYDPHLYDAGGQVISAVPPPAAPAASEPVCRDVTRNVTIGGQLQHATGTACRQADGSWLFVN